MDTSVFDDLARMLGGAATRRVGLRAAVAAGVAAALGRGAGEDAAAKPGRMPAGGPWPAGPCGPKGSDNACRADRDCCTGYCSAGKGGKAGRCRCLKRGKPCTASQTCCGGAPCRNGVCPRRQKCVHRGDACKRSSECCKSYQCKAGVCQALVATGRACRPADTCEDANAVCQEYDGENPAGTYCLLPTGAACSGNDDCYSQDCADGACAAVACTVCASGCPFSDLASALATPPADGRIKIAPGTWVNTAGSADVTQSLRIEACGGAPGVILQPSQYYTLSATDNVTLTVRNIEFEGSATAGLGASGSSAAAMAALDVKGCTFRGDSGYYSLYPYGHFTATIRDCTMDGAGAYVGGDGAGDPSAMTFSNCSFSGDAAGQPVILGNDLDLTFTDCTITDGIGGIVLESNKRNSILTISRTTITGNTALKRAGGGVLASAGDGITVAVALGDGVSITGNSAPPDKGSGIAAVRTAAGQVTVTGAPGKVSGNTSEPQCVRSTDGGATYSPVANCAY
ncbi:MAG: right-handed parallel beta-helix repeat-containing protein [Chloroflexota bacterium]